MIYYVKISDDVYAKVLPDPEFADDYVKEEGLLDVHVVGLLVRKKALDGDVYDD